MIIEELKPLDRCAPIARGPMRDSTGIGGSSLGGLVSLHLGFNHPAVFGRVAALSPSVWWDRKAILKTVREARPKPKLRVWVDMGTAEGRRGLDDARLLKAALVGLGFVEGVDLHYAEYEGATHSEQAWSERVGPMLEWLFPGTSPIDQYVNIRSFSSASFSNTAVLMPASPSRAPARGSDPSGAPAWRAPVPWPTTSSSDPPLSTNPHGQLMTFSMGHSF